MNIGGGWELTLHSIITEEERGNYLDDK